MQYVEGLRRPRPFNLSIKYEVYEDVLYLAHAELSSCIRAMSQAGIQRKFCQDLTRKNTVKLSKTEGRDWGLNDNLIFAIVGESSNIDGRRSLLTCSSLALPHACLMWLPFSPARRGLETNSWLKRKLPLVVVTLAAQVNKIIFISFTKFEQHLPPSPPLPQI